MSGPSKIEWADSSWNPISGCTKVSKGCQYCYAERDSARLAGRSGYPADNPFRLTLHPDRLAEPLHWRKPRKIFVCSMSDLFHPDVPDEFIDQVLAVMAIGRRHTFQCLTKRPDRMAAYIVSRSCGGSPHDIGFYMHSLAPELFDEEDQAGVEWPLPNVWLGTSVEDQATADERIPHLLRCPAAVRFVSYEPALGPVDFRRIRQERPSVHGLVPIAGGDTFDVLRGERVNDIGIGYDAPKIDWVIAGGESGPRARPSHPDWFRSVRDHCRAAGVPFFFKQVGEWSWDNTGFTNIAQVAPNGWWERGAGYCGFGRDHPGAVQVWRVRKKAAGRLLDGREWNEFPEARS